MAQVDVNLLARLGFVMKSDGAGEKITLSLRPRYQAPTDPGVTPPVQTGWADIDFSTPISISSGFDEDTVCAPYSVTPQIDTIPRFPDQALDSLMQGYMSRIYGVKRFMDFVYKNPIHITELNLRASNVESIPQQIIILSPDIAGGQMQRQVIDVAARKDAYQYQNNIITIGGLDVYVGRDSVIRFEGTFNHNMPVSQSDNVTMTDIPCYLDITIDRYISLEKALVENIKLLSTATGQANAITAEISKAEAVNAPLSLNTTEVNPAFNSNLVAGTIYPSIPQFQNKRRR